MTDQIPTMPDVQPAAPVPTPPATPPTPPVVGYTTLSPKPGKKRKSPVLLVLSAFLITLIVIGTGLYVAFGDEIRSMVNSWMGKSETTEESGPSGTDESTDEADTPAVTDPISTPISTPVATAVTVTAADMPLFYTLSDALWMRSSAGTDTRLLASGANSFYRISGYDDSHIGYSRCETVTGDFGCAVYSMNWKTATETLLWAGGPDDYIHQVAFYDADTWAVLVEISSGASINWRLELHDGATVTTIFDDDYTGAYGRGGYVEDASVLAFSPDGTYLLQISTSSPRSISDFRVYVYDMAGTAVTEIPDATQPVWVDDTHILYRDKVADAGALWTVPTGEKTVIASIPSHAYRYQLHPDGTEVAFFTDSGIGEVWIYTIETRTALRVGTAMLDSTWSFNNALVGYRTEACPAGGCDMPFYGDVNMTDQTVKLNTDDGTSTVVNLAGGRALTVEYNIWN